ncbi:hypothetical protein F4678DRAFT_24566 [Xylaria arbuscula]|nr:hypothetical protein F4678DRAFT_24566 [Xylaria arbuscula]
MGPEGACLVVGLVVAQYQLKPLATEIVMASRAGILISASVYEGTEALRCLCMSSSRFAPTRDILYFCHYRLLCDFVPSMERGTSHEQEGSFRDTSQQENFFSIYHFVRRATSEPVGSWARASPARLETLSPRLSAGEGGMKQCRPPSISL